MKEYTVKTVAIGAEPRYNHINFRAVGYLVEDGLLVFYGDEGFLRAFNMAFVMSFGEITP